MTTTDLSELAKTLSDLANANLHLLKGKCQKNIEEQDYYLGILRRQAILLSDLSLLLNNRDSEYISTPFIILRSLLDDFLHLLYLENQKDKSVEITKINADSYRQSFISLELLTNSNDEHFNGLYPSYLTHEKLIDVKEIFANIETNTRYLKNRETIALKGFMSFTEMVKTIRYNSDVDRFKDRAYYLWKEFSSFAHYSNYSFYYELKNAKENLNMIDESFKYCYNSIYLSFKYFEPIYSVEFKDNPEIGLRYGIIHKC